MSTISSPVRFPWYVRRLAWPIGVLLLILFVSVIIWLAKPQPSFSSPSVTYERTDLQEILTMQEQKNEALQSEIASTEQTLKHLVCEPGADHSAEPASREPISYTGQSLKTADLQNLIVQSVVLVVGETKSKGSRKAYNTGTGFFISSNEIITNAHVIDGVSNNKLTVYNDFTKKSAPATIVHTDYKRSFGGRDYAILRVDGFEAPGTLRISRSASQLMDVVSAGYPGVYREVISGLVDFDQNSLPPFIMTDGIVSSISDSKHHVPTLSHTAEIHGGNSGGPLVNRCGAVVGINTFTATPGSPPAKINFALGGSDLAGYLSANGIVPEVVNEVCE